MRDEDIRIQLEPGDLEPPMQLTLAEFFRDNDFTAREQADIRRVMLDGNIFVGGGGASGTWTATRI